MFSREGICRRHVRNCLRSLLWREILVLLMLLMLLLLLLLLQLFLLLFLHLVGLIQFMVVGGGDSILAIH